MFSDSVASVTDKYSHKQVLHCFLLCSHTSSDATVVPASVHVPNRTTARHPKQRNGRSCSADKRRSFHAAGECLSRLARPNLQHVSSNFAAFKFDQSFRGHFAVKRQRVRVRREWPPN